MSEKIEKITIYQMKDFTEVKEDSKWELTDSAEIRVIRQAFKGAKKQPGIVNMAEPQYRLELDKNTYFLWIGEDSGTIMNVEDTHTIYSLSSKSAKRVYEIITLHQPDESSSNSTETKKQGDFEVRIFAEQDQELNVYATLTYRGEEESIDIYHATWIFYFGITQLDGDYETTIGMEEPLRTTTLVKDEPHVEQLKTDTLNLKPGKYKFEAIADFSTNSEKMLETGSEIPVSTVVEVK